MLKLPVLTASCESQEISSTLAHHHHPINPRPPYFGPCPIICVCCSANLCPILSELAINFCTHRFTHPVSLLIRLLVVKSSVQASKQRSTRLENIWVLLVRVMGRVRTGIGRDDREEEGKEGDARP
jgi:hypothetical protein